MTLCPVTELILNSHPTEWPAKEDRYNVASSRETILHHTLLTNKETSTSIGSIVTHSVAACDDQLKVSVF